MVAVGFALVWAGYTVGIWGWLLVGGYDVSFADCFAMTWPGATVVAPTPGHKLGTITGPGVSTTNPGQGTGT